MFNRFLVPGKYVLAAAILLAGVPFSAQAADRNHPETDSVVGNSGLKISQREMLTEFEADSQKEYTLGAGDEIEVQVTGQNDLQGHHVLGPDGVATLPLIGPVKLSGMTREGAAQVLAKAWTQYYKTVNVEIRVTKYGSNRIVVVGRVATPGPLFFDSVPTLLEVLARAGAYGARPDNRALGSSVTVPASATSVNRCAIYRGSEQVLWVDMKDLLASGGAGVDLHLRRDDVVYVPDEQDDLISVLGQVTHPGAVKVNSDTTVIDVLAMSGGLTEDAASTKIQLVRPSTGMTREFSLKDLLNPAKAQTVEISLQRGDVLYVPKSGLGKMGYVMNKFSGVGSMMMAGSILVR